MDSTLIKIGNRQIGINKPCFIVGEVAQAHDGSLGMAHAFIDAIADAGADAVKFQTHIAKAESSNLEPFRVKFSKQDATRYDYWKRMEFSPEQWQGLAQHAKERKLFFLSSPFSSEAVELLESLNVPAWKIASGEANNLLLLERIFQTKKPILLSTGLVSEEELDRLVNKIKGLNLPLLILQCTTSYPVPAEKLGLDLIGRFKEKYQVPVGFSDHSGTSFASLAAVTLGANLVEVHVTFSRKMFGPDVPASLTPKELTRMVEGVRYIEKALSNPLQKKQLSENEKQLRTTFGRSLVAARDLPTGNKMAKEDFTTRKPGTGIPAAEYQKYIGKKIKRSIPAGTFLNPSDFE